MCWDNPCLCFSPIIFLHHNGNVNTVFCFSPLMAAHSQLHFCFHRGWIWKMWDVTYPQQHQLTSFSKSNTLFFFLYTPQSLAETLHFQRRLPALCGSFCVVHWDKKGSCLYSGTIAAAKSSCNLTVVLQRYAKGIDLDHKPLCANRSTSKFMI